MILEPSLLLCAKVVYVHVHVHVHVFVYRHVCNELILLMLLVLRESLIAKYVTNVVRWLSLV